MKSRRNWIALLSLGLLCVSGMSAEAACRARRCSQNRGPASKPVEISWTKTKEFWSKQVDENPTAVAGIVGGLVTLAGVSFVMITSGTKPEPVDDVLRFPEE